MDDLPPWVKCLVCLVCMDTTLQHANVGVPQVSTVAAFGRIQAQVRHACAHEQRTLVVIGVMKCTYRMCIGSTEILVPVSYVQVLITCVGEVSVGAWGCSQKPVVAL